MTEEDKQHIEDLRRKVAALKQNLVSAQLELRQAETAATGIVVDSQVVLYKGEEYLVRDVDPHWDDSWSGLVWIIGSPRNRDGTWSKYRKHLFGDWTERK